MSPLRIPSSSGPLECSSPDELLSQVFVGDDDIQGKTTRVCTEVQVR